MRPGDLDEVLAIERESFTMPWSRGSVPVTSGGIDRSVNSGTICGVVIRTIKNQSGADMVWFNPGDNHYFLARSAAAGPNQLLGIVDADGLSQDQSVATTLTPGAPNAHSVAADPIMNQVYVPIPGGNKSNVCSTAGGSDTLGCIAVFTTPNDDRPERTADNRDGRDRR